MFWNWTTPAPSIISSLTPKVMPDMYFYNVLAIWRVLLLILGQKSINPKLLRSTNCINLKGIDGQKTLCVTSVFYFCYYRSFSLILTIALINSSNQDIRTHQIDGISLFNLDRLYASLASARDSIPLFQPSHLFTHVTWGIHPYISLQCLFQNLLLHIIFINFDNCIDQFI